MNTTQIKYLKIILLTCTLFFSEQILNAQEPKKNESINIRVYNGCSILMNKLKDRQLDDLKYYSGIRVFWQPEYMLGLGIDMSYLTIDSKYIENIDTEFGKTNFDAKMYSFPIDIVFSMKFNDLEIFGGGGVALIYSEIEAFNESANSSFIGADYLFGLNYYLYNYKSWDFSISSLTHISPKINKSNTSINLAVQYRINI